MVKKVCKVRFILFLESLKVLGKENKRILYNP